MTPIHNPVELVQIRRRRYRHPMVAAEVADLALYAALLVPGRGGAELQVDAEIAADKAWEQDLGLSFSKAVGQSLAPTEAEEEPAALGGPVPA
jgi:hypothetical protein